MTIQSTKKKSSLDLKQNVKKLLNVTAEDLDKVLNINGVTATALEDMVANIRDWYGKQPQLPQDELHSEVVIRRLITQGFSIERVKEKIDNYYAARHKMPELLCGRDPLAPQLDKCLKQSYWLVLPQKTPDNKRVTIFRSNPSCDVATEVVKVAFMLADYRLWNDDMGGDHWIFDLQNLTIQHAIQFTPILIKKIMFYLNYCFGPKVVGMHLVNLQPYMLTILNLFKKSMKTKMVQRLHTYQNFEELYEILPRPIFPKEYGGDENISCQDISDEWRITFQSTPWRDYFVEQDKIYTDESKRTAPVKADEIFGLAGSFRKLDLD